MYRIGLIGAGAISAVHQPAWEAAHARAEVVAVADRDIEAAERLASVFQAKTFPGFRELFRDAAVDAVDICLPPKLHVEVVTEAARRGVHVLCEKPVARSLQEADEIGTEVRASGITYLPAHNTIFYPTIRRAREYLARGDLGAVSFVRSWDCETELTPRAFGEARNPPAHRPGEDWRSSTELLGGGALIDGGFHGVYRLLYLVQKQVTRVTALTGRFHPELGWQGEDTALLTVQFSDESLGEVLISYAFDSPTIGPDRLFTAVGREGVLSGNEAELQLRLATWERASVQRLSDLRGQIAWRDTFRREIEHFLDVLDGRTAPIQTFDEARAALQLIRAAYEAADTGRTVLLSGDTAPS